jgi:hypothetical protein
MRYNRHSVRSRAGLVNDARFQRVAVDLGQACRSTIGDENLAIVCDNTRRFRKAVQRREMAAGIVINHLNPIQPGMCHEYATSFRIKSSMIE